MINDRCPKKKKKYGKNLKLSEAFFVCSCLVAHTQEHFLEFLQFLLLSYLLRFSEKDSSNKTNIFINYTPTLKLLCLAFSPPLKFSSIVGVSSDSILYKKAVFLSNKTWFGHNGYFL